MTNFERLTAESWNTHGITNTKPKRGIAADDSVIAAQGMSFAEALSGVTSENAASLMSAVTESDADIPKQWTDDNIWGGAVAAIRVNDYLQNKLGIDTSKRIPTYEITDEQKEWLCGRHDFEFIKNGGDSKELGELLGDLIYMNVISSTDAINLMSPGLPIDPNNPNNLVYLGDENDSSNNIDTLLDRIKKYIEMLRRDIKLNSSSWNVNYIEKTHEFLKSKEKCFGLLSSLLGAS